MKLIPAGCANTRLPALGLILACLACPIAAQTLPDCVGEADDQRRLECYDRLFRDARRGEAPAESAEARRPSPARDHADDDGIFGAFWELDPGHRRALFTLRSHLPNFLLPLHYSSKINREPGSPTHPAGKSGFNYQTQEAKFQISLRAKVGADLLVDNDSLWLAYTQRSLWQLWNREESSPFRNTDYQPEAIYVIPVKREWSVLPAGWRWRMVQLGIAHQSNGQGDPLSRSWNRVHAGVAVEKGSFGLQARVLRRLKAYRLDDNPDLVDFVGNTEIAAAWLSGPAWSALTWRTHTDSLSRGSLQLDWSYPVVPDRPAGLRWYVQLFSGYGETLIDYNHRQNSIGLGLALFQF